MRLPAVAASPSARSAARSHPLHTARHQHAFMAVIVAMAHAPIQHVGHGLEPAMRMFREARDVVIRRIRPELVEQQERIEVLELRLTNHTPELHARASEVGTPRTTRATPRGWCLVGRAALELSCYLLLRGQRPLTVVLSVLAGRPCEHASTLISSCGCDRLMYCSQRAIQTLCAVLRRKPSLPRARTSHR